MSDTPKFEVIDRRKKRAEEEQDNTTPAPQPEQPSPAGAGPRLVVTEGNKDQAPAPAAEEQPEEFAMPDPPTAEETAQQKTAYDASAQRIEDLLRAQNPAMDALPPVTFENLIRQFYLSAMIQMGAGTQDGQRPRVDIVGARSTIDLMGVLAEKTHGNLTDTETKMLDSALFEARMAFLEITSMISLQGVQAPPPQGK